MTRMIYLLDPDTGLLVGTSVHPLDPVETERSGKPVYALLNPTYATAIAPPALPEGKRARMVDGAWLLEAVPLPPAPQPEPPTELPTPTTPEPPTFEQRQVAFRGHVQEYMDSMARALGYDDIKTAVTYAEEPAVPRFQNEGKALRAWRSMLWAACYALLDKVKSGEMEEPTLEELPGLLPLLEIPPLEATNPTDDLARQPAAQPVPTPTTANAAEP